MTVADGTHRKQVMFTEDRNTFNYLVEKLRTHLRKTEAVVGRSTAESPAKRRIIQQRFTQDKDCTILIATDAAGEGINLQRAHLMVNYDLPMEPQPHRTTVWSDTSHRPN